MLISIPAHIQQIIGILEAHGFQAWCVGGCVRDALLGRTPSDWDITTDALPQEIQECCTGFPTFDIGAKHGTVTVLADSHPVEITTFRADGQYLDHRHPQAVTFSRSLADDLSRRDFTVNAMAYHPEHGLVDRFGGREDLEAKLLRCVGQPEQRFEEDALRILRCLRFASVLSFSIEPQTAAALSAKQGLLREISRERLCGELTKLLCGNSAEDILRKYSQVIFTVLPELSPMAACTQETPYHCFDVWEHTLHAVGAIPPEAILRWAALLHDCGKPRAKFSDDKGVAHFYGHEKESALLADAILKRLCFSNRERESILELVALHGEIHPVAAKRLKKLLGRLDEDAVFRLFQLSRADLAAQAPHLLFQRLPAIEKSEETAREILKQEDCLSLRDLAVSGRDLLSAGFSQGPALGKALEILLDRVLEGNLPNEKAALLQEAERLLKSGSL